jgi:hypothetical protein
MYSIGKNIVSVIAIAFMAGCQATPQPVPRSALVTTPTGFLTCRDCKVAVVQDPVTDPQGRLIGYRPHQVMQCPDCKDNVQAFPSGEGPGDITVHTCTTCGESIAICSMHKAPATTEPSK